MELELKYSTVSRLLQNTDKTMQARVHEMIHQLVKLAVLEDDSISSANQYINLLIMKDLAERGLLADESLDAYESESESESE